MKRRSLHERDWQDMAMLDPLWAILSRPDKRFGRWDLEEFLHTGEQEIADLMRSAEGIGLPRQRHRAIDFGCGIGRLTRALKAYFTECQGVDISSQMIEMARTLTPACEFHKSANLNSFPDRSADLIYSCLVLQHQPNSKSAASLIKDMVRVLAPGGLLVFQMPLHIPFRNRLQLRRRAYRFLRALHIHESVLYERLRLSPIRMVALSRADVEELVSKQGGRVVEVEQTTRHSDPFASGLYFCTVEAG